MAGFRKGEAQKGESITFNPPSEGRRRPERKEGGGVLSSFSLLFFGGEGRGNSLTQSEGGEKREQRIHDSDYLSEGGGGGKQDEGYFPHEGEGEKDGGKKEGPHHSSLAFWIRKWKPPF